MEEEHIVPMGKYAVHGLHGLQTYNLNETHNITSSMHLMQLRHLEED
jgi:hypothetical protein